jgi:hypothetical protein
MEVMSPRDKAIELANKFTEGLMTVQESVNLVADEVLKALPENPRTDDYKTKFERIFWKSVKEQIGKL